MIELEILVLFICCMFFSALYEVFDEKVSLGAFAFISWWIFAAYYIASGMRLPVLALLPFGIGVIYLVRCLVNVMDIRRMSRELD